MKCTDMQLLPSNNSHYYVASDTVSYPYVIYGLLLFFFWQLFLYLKTIECCMKVKHLMFISNCGCYIFCQTIAVFAHFNRIQNYKYYNNIQSYQIVCFLLVITTTKLHHLISTSTEHEWWSVVSYPFVVSMKKHILI